MSNHWEDQPGLHTPEKPEELFAQVGRSEVLSMRNVDLLTEPAQELSREVADQLLSLTQGNTEALLAIEAAACLGEVPAPLPMIAQLCIKLAISKSMAAKIDHPTTVAVVVPVYHELTRMRPRGPLTETSGSSLDHIRAPHPHGEDFVRMKAAQLAWLYEGNHNVSYRVVYVDDGCEMQSGQHLEAVLAATGLESTAEVLYLQRAIQDQARDPSTRTLSQEAVSEFHDPKQSHKAGAIYLGMARAVEAGADVVLY